MSEPISLYTKCNDIDLAPSLSLSESSGTKSRHSFAKWSYSLHLKHLILSLFILVLNPNLELDGDLSLLYLSLDLDCVHVLLFSKVLPVLFLNLPQKITSLKVTSTPSISSIPFNTVSTKRSISSPIISLSKFLPILSSTSLIYLGLIGYFLLI